MGYCRKCIFSLSLYFLCMVLCGCSQRIPVGESKLAVETESVQLVLQANEIEQLDQFPALRSADLSGSTCYEEIVAWAETHPQVNVTYTVTFPDGTVVDSQTEVLDLSGLSENELAEASPLIQWLPRLKTLILMPGKFSPQQIATLYEKYPNLSMDYSFSLGDCSVDYFSDEVDLSGLDRNDLALVLDMLPILPSVKTVRLGSEQEQAFTWEDIYALVQACPDAQIDYSFQLYGKPCNLMDKELDLSYMAVPDNGQQLFMAARCMPELEYVDMDSCGLSNETMAQLRDALPGVTVVWRVFFGQGYSVRTDVERILASKPSAAGLVGDVDAQVLKYCTKVKYLDLGHNEFITDISFVSSMPELEVAVFAMNQISDLGPLANCPKLEYLEVQTNFLHDLSPLASCPKLAHLNLAHNRDIADISPLFGLEKMERLWLGSGNRVPQEQIDTFVQHFPDCEIDLHVFADPTAGHWRIIDINIDSGKATCHPRYELLQEQLGYLEEAYSFSWKDPLYRGP